MTENSVSRRTSRVVLFLLLCAFPIGMMNDLFGLEKGSALNSAKGLAFIGSVVLVVLSAKKLKTGLSVLTIFLGCLLVVVTVLYRDAEDALYAVLFLQALVLLSSAKIDANFRTAIVTYYLLALLFVSLVFVLLSDRVEVAGNQVLAPLVEGPHTSSYTVCILLFLIVTTTSFHTWKPVLRASVLAIVVYILIGYGARNAVLGLTVAIGSIFYFQNKSSLSVTFLYLYMLLFLLAVLAFYVGNLSIEELNQEANGRISAWTERLGILAERDIIPLLFGQGIGDDIRVTPTWWWEEKASHNDFISLVFNGGLVSLLLYIALIVALFRNANPIQKSLLIFLIFTSLTNTGLLGRPIQLLYFSIAFALAGTREVNSRFSSISSNSSYAGA
ncbi:hypothetical protein E2F43_15100 [Seongchinamella unica]|uniref:O-antigen ligase n=1 Tax=Seongchinamella unica TaxID=2547392 RepID=A0A4R5LQN3_9GAMM|nr:hypothetical protein [Seongchinamella unica]TDG12882.1 hypothetical protein E2F43_15100 [Seongchinamella unica]